MILMIVNDLKRSNHCDHLNFCGFRENIPTLLSKIKCTIYNNNNDHKKPEVRPLNFFHSYFRKMIIMITLSLSECCDHLFCQTSMAHIFHSIMKKETNYLDHGKKSFEIVNDHLIINPEVQP